MPIRSEAVTAPQDRPDEPKAPATPKAPEPKGEPKDDSDDQSKDAPKDEPLRSRVIAVPMVAATDENGDERREPDFFGLSVESFEPTDTDYGDIAKVKVKAPKSVLDDLEERAHAALTHTRTVNPR